jgi:hypothetical protein
MGKLYVSRRRQSVGLPVNGESFAQAVLGRVALRRNLFFVAAFRSLQKYQSYA